MRARQEILWRRDHEDGMRLSRDGCYPEAEAKLRSALEHARVGGIRDARLASTLYQLALLSERRGHPTEALGLYRRALDVEEKALGPDHPYVAMILRGYANLLRRQHHPARAAELAARAEAIWNGDEHGRCAEWSGSAA